MNKMIQNILLILSIIGGLTIGYEAKNVNSKLKLVIDHDGGADDAMAIAICILYERYFDGPEVVALTTTHGNVNESQAYKNSQRFLDITGRRDVLIYRGATEALVIPVMSDFFFGHDGIGDNVNNTNIETIDAQEQDAAVGLIELSKKYEGKLVVLAIGPQTNIALAQKLDPGFIGRLAQLYVAAGHIQSKEHPYPEFNALMDVEAYKIIADNAKADKVTLVPFSQIYPIGERVTREWRQNVLGAINTPLMHSLNSFERLSIGTSEKWHLLDPAAAAIALSEDLVGEYNYSRNNIYLCDSERGITSNLLGSKDANTRLVYCLKEEHYKTLLLDVFSAELKDCKNKKG